MGICSFINCITSLCHGKEDVVQKGSWVGQCSGSSGAQGHWSHFTVVESLGFVFCQHDPGVEKPQFLLKLTSHLKACFSTGIQFVFLHFFTTFGVSSRLFMPKLSLCSSNQNYSIRKWLKSSYINSVSTRPNLFKPPKMGQIKLQRI